MSFAISLKIYYLQFWALSLDLTQRGSGAVYVLSVDL